MLTYLQPGDVIVLETFRDFVLLIEEYTCDMGLVEWKCLLQNGSTEIWPEFWLMNHGSHILAD